MQDVKGSTSLYQELEIYQTLRNSFYELNYIYLLVYCSICVAEFGL